MVAQRPLMQCMLRNRPAHAPPGQGLLDALDAVLYIRVQLPQAVDDIIRSLPVAASVGLQECCHLKTEGTRVEHVTLRGLAWVY